MAVKLMDKVLNFMGFEEEIEETEEKVEREPQKREDIPRHKKKEKATVLSLNSQRQVQVIVVEPNSFDEVQGITDNLKSHSPVIINLEQAEPDLAKRVIDFLSGATYALNGSLQKVGSGIFLFVPYNMDINSELRSHSDNKEKTLFPWVVQK